MKAKPKAATIDEYVAAAPPEQRAALQKLRKAIKAAAPKAVECISYGIAAFKLDGKGIAGFSAGAKHCSYFPMSGLTTTTLKADLKDYQTSKGGVQFQPEKPLPATLVKKLIKARIAEIEPGPAKPTKEGEVIAFLRKLKHPLKKDIESVRKIILGVSKEIDESIKWNAPSFRTSDHFATFNLRENSAVTLIFHRGVKPKGPIDKAKINDSKGLIKWLAPDRCMVTLGAGKDIAANRKAFERIVRDWMKQL